MVMTSSVIAPGVMKLPCLTIVATVIRILLKLKCCFWSFLPLVLGVTKCTGATAMYLNRLGGILIFGCAIAIAGCDANGFIHQTCGPMTWTLNAGLES